ncbi:MerR family transcriptional regulator [Terrisporobacter vanillatitrophus]|uniref:MerR family transcriptional regulator n=1 Tax=Terrisporobacter vanillatitrophus TaxID=3058402 RepID=UPI0033673868
MEIKEVELATGLSEDTIYFYENEGLIFIKRDSNSDRDYDEENIEQLKYIKLLLKLDIPISKIKELKNEKVSLKCILEEKIKELENNKINTEGKKDIINDILKNINKKKDINLNEYLKDIECIEKGVYAELISDLDKIGQRSLIFQLLITISLMGPILWFYLDITEKNYSSIGLKGSLSIISTIILTLIWRSYLQQKDKKISGTFRYIVGIILALVLTILIFVGIDWLQFKIFVPNNYLMYAFKPPYSYAIFLFEIEVLIMIIAILYKIRKANSDEHEWAYNLLSFMKRNVVKVIVLNLVLLYMCVTGITVITKDKIIDYNFYNPIGVEYTYEDITDINTGFLGKRKLLYGNKGDFYYNITLKNKKTIDLYQATSDFDDTYLELEIFDKLALDKSKAQKIASKENYKLCDLDKRYVDRFLRIIEN